MGAYSGTKTLTFTVPGGQDSLGGYLFTQLMDNDGLYYEVTSETELRNLSAYVNAGNNCDGIRLTEPWVHPLNTILLPSPPARMLGTTMRGTWSRVMIIILTAHRSWWR